MFASFCSLWELLLAVGRSPIFVSFFWSRQLNCLGLRPRRVGSRRPGALGKLPGSSRKGWKTGLRVVSRALVEITHDPFVDF